MEETSPAQLSRPGEKVGVIQTRERSMGGFSGSWETQRLTTEMVAKAQPRCVKQTSKRYLAARFGRLPKVRYPHGTCTHKPCIFVHMYIYLYMYIYIYRPLSTYVYICIDTYTYLCIHTRMLAEDTMWAPVLRKPRILVWDGVHPSLCQNRETPSVVPLRFPLTGILTLYTSTLPCKWWFPYILVEQAMFQMGKMYLLRIPV